MVLVVSGGMKTTFAVLDEPLDDQGQADDRQAADDDEHEVHVAQDEAEQVLLLERRGARRRRPGRSRWWRRTASRRSSRRRGRRGTWKTRSDAWDGSFSPGAERLAGRHGGPFGRAAAGAGDIALAALPVPSDVGSRSRGPRIAAIAGRGLEPISLPLPPVVAGWSGAGVAGVGPSRNRVTVARPRCASRSPLQGSVLRECRVDASARA